MNKNFGVMIENGELHSKFAITILFKGEFDYSLTYSASITSSSLFFEEASDEADSEFAL